MTKPESSSEVAEHSRGAEPRLGATAQPYPPNAWYARLVAAVSTPVMALILALAYLWTTLVPRKRRALDAARAALARPCPWYVGVWLFACVLLDRWPYFVLVIFGGGAAVGLVIGGPSSISLALVSAVFGASLAPVFAADLPKWLFASR